MSGLPPPADGPNPPPAPAKKTPAGSRETPDPKRLLTDPTLPTDPRTRQGTQKNPPPKDTTQDPKARTGQQEGLRDPAGSDDENPSEHSEQEEGQTAGKGKASEKVTSKGADGTRLKRTAPGREFFERHVRLARVDSRGRGTVIGRGRTPQKAYAGWTPGHKTAGRIGARQQQGSQGHSEDYGPRTQIRSSLEHRHQLELQAHETMHRYIESGSMLPTTDPKGTPPPYSFPFARKQEYTTHGPHKFYRTGTRDDPTILAKNPNLNQEQADPGLANQGQANQGQGDDDYDYSNLEDYEYDDDMRYGGDEQGDSDAHAAHGQARWEYDQMHNNREDNNLPPGFLQEPLHLLWNEV
jgi:hypothetical protein